MAASMPNSTSPAPDFFDYLTRSFRLLEAGMPAAYQALCAAAGELSVRLVATGDARVLRFRGRIPVFEADGAADLEVVFDHRVILDLIDGRVALEDALLLDRLWIRGRPGALEQFHAGLIFYLNGAIRLSECLELLRYFRTACIAVE
jgi:hypothetical protein